MHPTPRHKVFISCHHADQVYKEYFALTRHSRNQRGAVV